MALHIPEPEDFINGVDPDPDYESDPRDQPFNVIVACVLGERTVGDALATLIEPIDHLFAVEGTNPEVVHQLGNVAVCSVLIILSHIFAKVPYDHPGQHKLAQILKGLKQRRSPKQDGTYLKDGDWAPLNNWMPRYDRYKIGWDDGVMVVQGLEIEELDAELGLKEWTNCHGFLARLIALPGYPDYLFEGMVAMQTALEVGSLTPLDLGIEVPAAAVLILCAGEVFWKSIRCWQSKVVKEPHWLPMIGDLWKGEQCLSKERWALWKERFKWVAECEEVRGDSRDLAAKAVKAMDEIEEGKRPLP